MSQQEVLSTEENGGEQSLCAGGVASRTLFLTEANEGSEVTVSTKTSPESSAGIRVHPWLKILPCLAEPLFPLLPSMKMESVV